VLWQKWHIDSLFQFFGLTTLRRQTAEQDVMQQQVDPGTHLTALPTGE
jgi:hypothetical protein